MRIRIVEPSRTPRVRIVDDSGGDLNVSRGGREANTPQIKLAGPIEYVPIDQLKPPLRELRSHPQEQIRKIEDSIRAFGFAIPVVADRHNIIRAGVACVMAAKGVGLREVPVVRLEGLSDAKLRAFQLAVNKLAERSKWNRKALFSELPELKDLLIEEGLGIEITGFEPIEIDQLALDFENETADPIDDFDAQRLDGTPVSRLGDRWKLETHDLSCGDGRNVDALQQLLGGRRADMAFLDLPYNVRIKGVVGRGRIKHDEFAMASGEMKPHEYIEFLKDSFGAAAAVSRNGAVHYACMDWRHIEELMVAGRHAYGVTLNLAVWVKSNAGQGSFYRSQHELIGVFRVGDSQHQNNVQLGKHGRSRSNVWPYPGTNSFRTGRLTDLSGHPTVKPVALICDAIRDCTRRDDTIIDTFCGSGTTVLAAERLGRRAVCVEIEPKYVDLTIRRWQEFSGKDAVHAATGRSFNEIAGRQRKKASS